MALLPVHSYGRCLNNRPEPALPDDPRWPSIAQKRARKIKVLSRYKFYLAFENAPIVDYVSEKVRTQSPVIIIIGGKLEKDI